jgi:hypothetical protein
MPKVKDMSGQRFGRLVAISPADRPLMAADSCKRWLCECDCGHRKLISGARLRAGRIESCGCLYRSKNHGMSGLREYRIWRGMLHRCNSPSNIGYHNYGGRGISVCERWMEFSNFHADMGSPPTSKHTLDRINGDGNYEPNNCRWADRATQSRNGRRARTISANGRAMCIKDWSDTLGVNYQTMRTWLRRGRTIEQIIAEMN